MAGVHKHLPVLQNYLIQKVLL